MKTLHHKLLLLLLPMLLPIALGGCEITSYNNVPEYITADAEIVEIPPMEAYETITPETEIEDDPWAEVYEVEFEDDTWPEVYEEEFEVSPYEDVNETENMYIEPEISSPEEVDDGILFEE